MATVKNETVIALRGDVDEELQWYSTSASGGWASDITDRASWSLAGVVDGDLVIVDGAVVQTSSLVLNWLKLCSSELVVFDLTGNNA